MAKDKDNGDKAAAGEPKGGGKAGIVKLAIGAVLVLGLGAGGAYGAFAAGLLGGKEAGPDRPQLVRKGETDPYAPAGDGKDKDKAATVHGEGGSKYRTAYYSFADSFTANVADSAGLIQVELAVSTQRDGRVLQWVQTHELAIRSAILVELAATPEAEAFDPVGKRKLAQRLTKAINGVLEANEGFGGIENVHFRGYLVQ